MYCIQVFLPLFLLPRPLQTTPVQALFVVFFLLALYAHHRPCLICTVALVCALGLSCNMGPEHCWMGLLQTWPSQMPRLTSTRLDIAFAL